MPILSLLARLNLDKSQFDAALKKAEHEVEHFGSHIGKQFALGAVLLGLEQFAHSILEAGAAAKNTADRLGITVQQAQEFALAAKLGGSDIEAFAAKFDKLRASLAGAKVSGEAGPFEAFGIGIEELTKMDAAQVLEAIGRSLEHGGFDAAKTDAFFKIFGRGASMMAKALLDLEHAKHGMMFSDAEVENMHSVEHSFLMMGHNLKIAGLRAAEFLIKYGAIVNTASELTGLPALMRFLGIGGNTPSGKRGFKEPEEASVDPAIKRRAEAVGDIISLEKQAQELSLKNAYDNLTTQEKLNKLYEERSDLLAFIQSQEKLGVLDSDAMLTLASAKLRATQAQADIQSLSKSTSNRVSAISNPLGGVGAFIGARSYDPSMSLSEINQSIKDLDKRLSTYGVAIKGNVR